MSFLFPILGIEKSTKQVFDMGGLIPHFGTWEVEIFLEIGPW